MAVFNQLLFNVDKKVYNEILTNPDRGFGFNATILNKDITVVQRAVMDFLYKCHKKGLTGSFNLDFETDGIGDIPILSRHVERIEKIRGGYIISNSY